MIDYLVNSKDVLNVVEGKLTVYELKGKILKQWLGLCNDESEKAQAIEIIENGFRYLVPLLECMTVEEWSSIFKYGSKIGATSYDINYVLRKKLPLNYQQAKDVKNIDNIMNRIPLYESLTVYRALKIDFLDGKSPEELINTEFTEYGYMSTSLTMEDSYAYFKDYPIVLEIILPIGTNGVYLEWIKASNDEKEFLVSRNQSIEIKDLRKEIVNGNEKIVYKCNVINKKLSNNNELRF